MADNCFKVELQRDYTLKIELGTNERIDLLEALRKAHGTLDKMCTWLNKQSQEEQEKYKDLKHNLRMSIGHLALICQLAGITDEDIDKYMNVPF